MGMAAGQARLLSITARLSDNEQNGQALSFAKQRLADEADQINREYNEALNATKLTVLTGFNGAEAQYTDISYGLLTEYNKLAGGKQYLVTDQKGQILVTKDIADAYKAGNGDFNVFINQFDLSQTDVDFTINPSLSDEERDAKQAENYQFVHDAWDKYLTSVGLSFEDFEHDYANDKIKFVWDPDISGIDAAGNVIPNVGAPCFVTSTIQKNGSANFINVGTPEIVPGQLAVDSPINDSMKLIPTFADDAVITINQQIRSGVPQTSNGYPIYIITGQDEGGNTQSFRIYVQSDSGIVYEPEQNTDSYVPGSEIGKFHQVLIQAVESSDGIHVDGTLSGATTLGNLFASQKNENLDYKTEGYNSAMTMLVDDNGEFYITDAASCWLGLLSINPLETTQPVNYEGTTKEQRELYDYAVALTKTFAGQDGTDVKSVAVDPENAAKIQYYRNIFNEMQQFGFITEDEMNINQSAGIFRGAVKTGTKDNNWFEQGLRQGRLLLKTYDATKGKFVNTTYAEDSNIQEVEDDRRIAKAQIDYDQAQTALERKDKKIDLDLKKLDTEHSALQTEYESVKSVVDKNIEKSFNIFS